MLHSCFILPAILPATRLSHFLGNALSPKSDRPIDESNGIFEMNYFLRMETHAFVRLFAFSVA